MESVVAYCSQCDHCLASLLNIWTQIGKSYVSPIIQGEDVFDIKPEGAIRQGENGTIVDSWGQLLLRIPSIRIKDPNSNATKKKTFIQRVLKLKNPPVDSVQYSDNDSQDDSHSPGIVEDYSHGQARDENPELSHMSHNIREQREAIERLDKVGYEIVASFNQAVQHIDEDVRRLRKEMEQLTRRSSHNNSETKALANDLASTKTEVSDLKKALQSSLTQSHLEQEASSIRTTIAKANKSLHPELTDKWKLHQKKIGALESSLESARSDTRELKTLLEDYRATANTSVANVWTNEIVTLKAELQHVKEELALERSYRSSNIGDRASQVETLRMEFDLLRSRVQRMETDTLTSKIDASADHQRQEPLNIQSIGMKRKASLISIAPPDVNHDHDSWLSSPTAHTNTLNSTQSVNKSKKTISTSPQGLTKPGTMNPPMVPKRGPKQIARKVKR
ncbi:hypothetical protein GGS21DRAFT_543051 [Xylaria nigripes]|nr:hypothetical protein GGS21DRAFT_543051 [Xylaria nigripes]